MLFFLLLLRTYLLSSIVVGCLKATAALFGRISGEFRQPKAKAAAENGCCE